MIRAKYNLKCTDGHYHYSPDPKVWLGRECAKPFGDPLRKDGLPRVTVEKCRAPLRLVP